MQFLQPLKKWKSPYRNFLLFLVMATLNNVRGAFNQECESIHKIRMNKGTEVVNSL